MIELVFVTCSLLAGNTCREQSMTFSTEAVSLMQCTAFAQPILAQWVAEHPNWTAPKRWTCQPAGLYAKA